METPPLLTSPVSVLLSNSVGFSAHVTVVQNTTTQANAPALSGELVARQGRLFWTPATPKSRSTDGMHQSFSFIWNVSQSSGYVLSEALQGYAPLTASLRYTNAIIAPDPENSVLGKLEGHRCASKQITALSNDGTTHRFKAWCAADLNGLPLKILLAGDDPASTVLLSQVRLEEPLPDMFEPPNGFTRYENTGAMAKELMLRQQSLHRRPESENPEHGADNQHRPGQGPPAQRNY